VTVPLVWALSAVLSGCSSPERESGPSRPAAASEESYDERAARWREHLDPPVVVGRVTLAGGTYEICRRTLPRGVPAPWRRTRQTHLLHSSNFYGLRDADGRMLVACDHEARPLFIPSEGLFFSGKRFDPSDPTGPLRPTNLYSATVVGERWAPRGAIVQWKDPKTKTRTAVFYDAHGRVLRRIEGLYYMHGVGTFAGNKAAFQAFLLVYPDKMQRALICDENLRPKGDPLPHAKSLTFTRYEFLRTLNGKKVNTYHALAVRSPMDKSLWLLLYENGEFTAPPCSPGVRPLQVIWPYRRTFDPAGWLVAFATPEGQAWGTISPDGTKVSGPRWKSVRYVSAFEIVRRYAGDDFAKRYRAEPTRFGGKASTPAYLMAELPDGTWQAYDPTEHLTPLLDQPAKTEAEALRLAEVESNRLRLAKIKAIEEQAARNKRLLAQWEAAQKAKNAPRRRPFKLKPHVAAWYARKRAFQRRVDARIASEQAAARKRYIENAKNRTAWPSTQRYVAPIRNWQPKGESTESRSARLRAYTNALNDYTYGRSSWKPVWR
jgi:hypothetical protein